jgi:hypothetical protein
MARPCSASTTRETRLGEWRVVGSLVLLLIAASSCAAERVAQRDSPTIGVPSPSSSGWERLESTIQPVNTSLIFDPPPANIEPEVPLDQARTTAETNSGVDLSQAQVVFALFTDTNYRLGATEESPGSGTLASDHVPSWVFFYSWSGRPCPAAPGGPSYPSPCALAGTGAAVVDSSTGEWIADPEWGGLATATP